MRLRARARRYENAIATMPRRPVRTGPATGVGKVMDLQRTAGNRAVNAALVRVNTPPRASTSAGLRQLAQLTPLARLALAGTPQAAAPPDGRTRLYSKSVGVAGLTSIPNAAGYTNPDFETDSQHEKAGGQSRHYAVVRSTTSPDVTIDSLYMGSGDHIWDGVSRVVGGVKYPYFTQVSQKVADLVRDGEQEHLNDAQRAYDIGYGLIANEINKLAGHRFGPASTPGKADEMALDALDGALPAALSTKQPGFRAAWVRTMDALLKMTKKRDDLGWHTVTETDPRRDDKKHRYVVNLVSDTSTKINQVTSDQVVNY